MPILGLLYIISPAMFVDMEATNQFNNKWLIPNIGLPKWWAEYHAINAVLWGDYTLIDFTQPLRISFI